MAKIVLLDKALKAGQEDGEVIEICGDDVELSGSGYSNCTIINVTSATVAELKKEYPLKTIMKSFVSTDKISKITKTIKDIDDVADYKGVISRIEKEQNHYKAEVDRVGVLLKKFTDKQNL